MFVVVVVISLCVGSIIGFLNVDLSSLYCTRKVLYICSVCNIFLLFET